MSVARPAWRLAALLGLGLAGGACAAEEGDEPELTEVTEAVTVLGGVRAGDEVTANGLAVVAPEAGERVSAVFDFADGTAATVTLETLADGTVVRIDRPAGDHADAPPDLDVGPEVDPEADPEDGTAAASPPACRDPSFSTLGFRWRRVYTFLYSDAVRGNGVSQIEAIGKLKEARSNVILTRNNCGLADLIDLQSAFGGITHTRPNISVLGCGARDGRNVVGFGTLPRGVGGATCVWSSAGSAIEADMMLATGIRMYATRPAGCTSSFSMEAIATHEFGHVFGLGHVGESTHRNLTMSTTINGPCQEAESTLGRGDVFGMRALY